MLVCYGGSLVYSSLVLLLFYGKTSNISSSVEPLSSQSLSNFMFQLKTDMVIVFITVLLMLQYSLFLSVASNRYVPPTSRDQKKRKGKMRMFICASIKKHISSCCCPYSILQSMLLLLSGDVEQNPGPATPTHQRRYSYPLSFQESMDRVKEECLSVVQQITNGLERCKRDMKELETQSNATANELRDELAQCYSCIDTLKKEIERLKADLFETKQDKTKVRDKLKAAQRKLETMSKKNDEYASRIARLEQQVNLLASSNTPQNTHPIVTPDSNAGETLRVICSGFNQVVKDCIDPQTCIPYDDTKYVKQLSDLMEIWCAYHTMIQNT